MIVEKELSSLGLTVYESQVYVSLVRGGAASAHVVSKESGVPYGKIYPVLASLEVKGFVQVFLGPPKRFVAVEPKLAFSRVIEKREEEVGVLRRKTESLLASIGPLSVRREEEPAESVRIIKGLKEYLELSILLHKVVKKEWLSISELTIYREHFDATKECIKRGVSVRILSYDTAANRRFLSLWTGIGAQVRFMKYTPTQFSVVDSAQATLRLLDEGYVSVWIRNPSLARQLREYFLVLWSKARRA